MTSRPPLWSGQARAAHVGSVRAPLRRFGNGAVMNSLTGGGAAFVLLGIVVMVVICTIIALIFVARKGWPTRRTVDTTQHYKLQQRLEQITGRIEQSSKQT